MSAVGLDNILATQSATSSTSSTITDKVAETKNMFLNLLVKQLQYQDPLNPVENTEFASQLAQFSQLESLSTMNSNIETMTAYQNSMNSMQAVSFIGKTVNASGNTINYTGGTSTINFNVKDNAATVDITVYNSSGTAVRHLEAKNVLTGDGSCTWDGKDDNGSTLSSGTYYFKISATDYSGNAVNTSTSTNGVITGIRYDNGTIYLEIGDKEITLSEIQKISG
jgi:flagellar basal-body rod modification protein FlgD